MGRLTRVELFPEIIMCFAYYRTKFRKYGLPIILAGHTVFLNMMFLILYNFDFEDNGFLLFKELSVGVRGQDPGQKG